MVFSEMAICLGVVLIGVELTVPCFERLELHLIVFRPLLHGRKDGIYHCGLWHEEHGEESEKRVWVWVCLCHRVYWVCRGLCYLCGGLPFGALEIVLDLVCKPYSSASHECAWVQTHVFGDRRDQVNLIVRQPDFDLWVFGWGASHRSFVPCFVIQLQCTTKGPKFGQQTQNILMTLSEIILAYLSRQKTPMGLAQIMADCGIDYQAGRQVLGDLLQQGVVSRPRRGVYEIVQKTSKEATTKDYKYDFTPPKPYQAPITFGTLFDAQGVLRRLRRSLRASTPEAFADAIGISLNVLKTWEAENTFSLDVILSASRRKKISLDWLLHGDHAEPGASTKDEPEQWSGIPVYSSAQAGGLVAYEVDPHAYDHVPVSPSAIGARNEQVFGLRVRGHSMYPYYLPGDVAICSADRSARVGQDVVLIRHGLGESTLKRLEHWEGQTAVLRPLHPRYRSQVVQIDPEDRLYPVIGLWRVPAEAEAWEWDKDVPEEKKK
jgi:SOS-response transcriptional repressor LexA